MEMTLDEEVERFVALGFPRGEVADELSTGRDFEHGFNGYNAHGCRGVVCRSEHTLQTLKTRQARRAYVREHGLPPGVEHGASAYTNWGCKCDDCRAGHNEECARYRR